jgi:hypothetical protein
VPDTAPSGVKAAETRPETLREKLPAVKVAAQVTSTLACTALLSFLGTAGTVIGLATGAVLSATVPTVLEHTARRSGSAARERYLKYRKRGLSPENARAAAKAETQMIDMRRRANRKKTYAIAAATAVAVFGGCALILTGIEAAAGKPVSALVQGTAAHGTTFTGSSGGSAPAPEPSLSPSFTPTATGTAPATTPAATLSPTAVTSAPATVSPSAAATTPVASPSPTPAATSPAATPAATAAPTLPAATATAPQPGGQGQ